MRHAVLTALCCLAMNASAGTGVKHAEFSIELPGDWTSAPAPNSERWNFVSEGLHSVIFVTLVPGFNIPREKLMEVAGKLVSARKKAESERRIQYADEWVELKPDGDWVSIGYRGYDDRGGVHRHLTYLTQLKYLSVWVVTSDGDDESSKKAFEQVFRGLQFYVP